MLARKAGMASGFSCPARTHDVLRGDIVHRERKRTPQIGNRRNRTSIKNSRRIKMTRILDLQKLEETMDNSLDAARAESTSSVSGCTCFSTASITSCKIEPIIVL
jgi:hypothetical protein